jgi:hypothetical protein
MNRTLANAVGFMNGFLAICIIVIGTLAGGLGGGGMGGAILGFLLASLVAVIVCGLVAVAIDIRNTLHSIDDKLVRPAASPPRG